MLQGERQRAGDNRVLGRFRLENIRPSRAASRKSRYPRYRRERNPERLRQGQDTGAEQRTADQRDLQPDQSEVERMIADSERHRDEDRRLRELTDARNELDGAAYAVEHLLSERGDAVPVHEKARADTLVADARQALKEEAPLDSLRSLTQELQQVYQSLSAAGATPPPQQDQQGPQGQQGGQPGGDDDVIDAEFTADE